MLTYQTNRNDVDGKRSTKALKGHGASQKYRRKKKRNANENSFYRTVLSVLPNCAMR